ncbi:MAG: hypothetical protein RUDDFDWM_000666 [Candidatus Fervidibacterota bacterium]
MVKKLKDIGELKLLSWIYSKLGEQVRSRDDVVVGVGDDAAVLKVERTKQLVITVDSLVEGVHFSLDYFTPSDVGWKALAVNLSDLAAMFAKPIAALVSFAVPSSLPFMWVKKFYHGMFEVANEFGVAVVGGDTSSSPTNIFISVSVIGVNNADTPLRSAAEPGDAVIVTGTFGDSAIGLRVLKEVGTHAVRRSKVLRHLAMRHLRPTPRVNEGLTAASTGLCKCAIDVSDGLASDLTKIAKLSGARIRLWLEKIPMSKEAIEASKWFSYSPLEMALTGGEDYELIMTVPKAHATSLCKAIKKKCGTKCTIVGEVESGEPVVYGVDSNGKLVEVLGGYEHFVS